MIAGSSAQGRVGRPRFMRIVMLLIAVMLVATSGPAFSQTAPEAPRIGQCYALIIGGLPGSPVYARRFQDWIKRFNAFLRTNGILAGNIVVLSGDKNFKDQMVTGVATRQSILEAVDKLSKSILPQDQFVLVMVGHGSLSDVKPGFVLPGVDLEADALAKAMATIRAENQVVLNFSGAGGDFLKALSRKGRVNMTATLPEESAEPVFAEFFLRGLESGRADGEGAPLAGAKDGKVTLLEAYNWASHQTALWICRQVAQKDGTWSIQGKESVEIFKKLFDGPEGVITPGGMRADGSRKLSEDSDASKPDEIVPLVVPADIKPSTAEAWEGRRLVNEHAQLEDCGKESGAIALRGEKGYEPVPMGAAEEEGSLAARVLLGRPTLLPAGEMIMRRALRAFACIGALLWLLRS